jgi:hypothetical protein
MHRRHFALSAASAVLLAEQLRQMVTPGHEPVAFERGQPPAVR